MASPSDLPQELVAKIIAEFRDDTANLRSCALVSRSFLPWSRLHLFFSRSRCSCGGSTSP
ncbi:hypothetical protein B0H11DRAFT_2069063 [Mycena galericulata]|nr:hypothetical protein B0H11DRAFT_2069063 [Mycena galericulata]